MKKQIQGKKNPKHKSENEKDKVKQSANRNIYAHIHTCKVKM